MGSQEHGVLSKAGAVKARGASSLKVACLDFGDELGDGVPLDVECAVRSCSGALEQVRQRRRCRAFSAECFGGFIVQFCITVSLALLLIRASVPGKSLSHNADTPQPCLSHICLSSHLSTVDWTRNRIRGLSGLGQCPRPGRRTRNAASS